MDMSRCTCDLHMWNNQGMKPFCDWESDLTETIHLQYHLLLYIYMYIKIRSLGMLDLQIYHRKFLAPLIPQGLIRKAWRKVEGIKR